MELLITMGLVAVITIPIPMLADNMMMMISFQTLCVVAVNALILIMVELILMAMVAVIMKTAQVLVEQPMMMISFQISCVAPVQFVNDIKSNTFPYFKNRVEISDNYLSYFLYNLI